MGGVDYTTSCGVDDNGITKWEDSALEGMYRDLGDAAAFEAELSAMQTPAERETEELRRFTEEVMRGL